MRHPRLLPRPIGPTLFEQGVILAKQGRILSAQGQLSEAIGLYREALAALIDSDDPRAKSARITVYDRVVQLERRGVKAPRGAA